MGEAEKIEENRFDGKAIGRASRRDNRLYRKRSEVGLAKDAENRTVWRRGIRTDAMV